ncbi:TPA: hypothetical protein DEP90_00350 [Patescibacteria group bacterium]|nr:hypothetical protein [Patescibacteria group bacterium]
MSNTVQKLQPYIRNTNSKPQKKWKFFLIPLFLGIYMIFLSPIVEPSIENILFSVVRNSKSEKFNFLTPVYATSNLGYSYSLSVIGEENPLDMVSSKTKYYIKDPRVLAMSEFLGDYNSPMQPYAEVFVVESDIYGLDWRLVASISGVESAFGNLIPHTGYNNGWGWRGGPAGAYSVFENFGDGIEHVTQRLALGYGISLTPFDIESTYCPPCARNPAHPWANGVTRYMNELEYYLNNLENI